MATEKEYLDLIHKKIAGEGVRNSRLIIDQFHAFCREEGRIDLNTVTVFFANQLGTIIANMRASQDDTWGRQIAEEAMRELGEL